MNDITGLLDLVEKTVGEVATSSVVAGTPIELGGSTIVPLCRVSVGFGAGGGKGEADEKKTKKGEPWGSGIGGGGGGGGKIRPVAVIVFGPDGVELHGIGDRRNWMEKLLDKIPELVDRFKPSEDDE